MPGATVSSALPGGCSVMSSSQSAGSCTCSAPTIADERVAHRHRLVALEAERAELADEGAGGQLEQRLDVALEHDDGVGRDAVVDGDPTAARCERSPPCARPGRRGSTAPAAAAAPAARRRWRGRRARSARAGARAGWPRPPAGPRSRALGGASRPTSAHRGAGGEQRHRQRQRRRDGGDLDGGARRVERALAREPGEQAVDGVADEVRHLDLGHGGPHGADGLGGQHRGERARVERAARFGARPGVGEQRLLGLGRVLDAARRGSRPTSRGSRRSSGSR